LQYCANDYQSILNKNGILISMTQNSELFENAVAKRINGILKLEFVIDKYNHDLQVMKPIVNGQLIFTIRIAHIIQIICLLPIRCMNKIKLK
jgi:hypothetical protein